MAFHGLRRGDITIHGINGGDEFGLRWHRLLFPADVIPTFYIGPMSPILLGPVTVSADSHGIPQVYGHAEPTLSIPIDETSIPSDDPASGGQSGAAGGVPAADGAPDLGDESSTGDLTSTWHPLYFPSPQTDLHAVPAPPPDDGAPPAGFIPKSDAIIWSGPAIMAFPPDSHDAGGDAPAPDTATADIPDAVTRADLDPVLTAMGSGADHAAPSDSGGADLSAAFLPAGSDDPAALSHGLDPGLGITPPPMPPPPDIIG